MNATANHNHPTGALSEGQSCRRLAAVSARLWRQLAGHFAEGAGHGPWSRALLVPVWVALMVPLAGQTPVSEVRSAQVPGTHQVRITYQVAAGFSGTIALLVSKDGGANYDVTVPPTAVSGDVGPRYYGAGSKTITLDAAATVGNIFTKQLRFKVAVTGVLVPGQMVLIPGGTFQMGDQSNPLVGWSDERPVHTVQVSAFYMGKYQVTKEEWDVVRAWGLNNGYTDLAVGSRSYASKGANHPVHSITWYDIVKWCNARSQKEGLTACYTISGATYKTGQNSAVVCNWSANGYRLPTEAEWEKAARGGQTGKNFPGGDTISQSQANYSVYSSNGTTNYYSYDVTPRPPATGTDFYHPSYTAGGYPQTAPVDSFVPNGYGLYNMSGNVWEWCWDWYSSSYYASSPGTDPRGPSSGSQRVARGGSWAGDADDCRVAQRVDFYATSSGNGSGMGLRLARSSVP